MNNDPNQLRDLCLRKENEKIHGCLDSKSNEDLLKLFAQIVNNNPFLYEPAIEIIVSRLYSDEDEFVDLLCKLIENLSYNLGFASIEETASKNPDMTIKIVKKIITRGTRPGICSGAIISPLIGRGLVDDEVVSKLKSDNPVMQRHSLVAIGNYFIKNKEGFSKSLTERLIEVSENVNQDNTDILIQCLVRALLIDKNSVLPILEKEIERRGYPAASKYIHIARFRENFPILLLKKAVQVIEAETPENEMIDDALAQIYEADPGFVVERLRERVNIGHRVPFASVMLKYNIQKAGASPVIKMLEEEINNGTLTMTYFGDSILKDFFVSGQELVEWCKKWKDDKNKETVVLRSLAGILTDLMNYQPSSVRDDAIAIVKEFATKKGTDYNELTKVINLGKDPNVGAEYKEASIKALYVINQILHPPIQINTAILERNLKNFPHLTEAIGYDWLVRSSKSKSPHLLAYIYSEEPDFSKIEELAKKFESEKNEKKRLGIALQYNFLASAALEQLYWEQIFKTLDDYSLKIPSSKLRDSDNAESILAEAEVLARLAPHFKVELEPDIEEFRPKRLDAKIECNGQEALIEVVAVDEKIELEVAHGGISVPGGKVKNVLLTKFKNQLKSGEADPEIPVVLILGLKNLDDSDVGDAIYGQLKFRFKTRTDTQQIVEKGVIRSNNSFYEEKNSDIVSVIAAYKRDYKRKDSLIGRLYRPPYQILPRNPMSSDFRLKLRNALFGESENSYWQSLLKIEGVDESTSKKLHAGGIEDLEILAMATDAELRIQGFEVQQLQKFQVEAKRILNALATDSIKFLKGIDQTAYDSMTKKGIHLITQVKELTGAPEGVNSSTWGVIMADAKRIAN